MSIALTGGLVAHRVIMGNVVSVKAKHKGKCGNIIKVGSEWGQLITTIVKDKNKVAVADIQYIGRSKGQGH